MNSFWSQTFKTSCLYPIIKQAISVENFFIMIFYDSWTGPRIIRLFQKLKVSLNNSFFARFSDISVKKALVMEIFNGSKLLAWANRQAKMIAPALKQLFFKSFAGEAAVNAGRLFDQRFFKAMGLFIIYTTIFNLILLYFKQASVSLIQCLYRLGWLFFGLFAVFNHFRLERAKENSWFWQWLMRRKK